MSLLRAAQRQRVFEIASEMLDFNGAEQAQKHGLSALCQLTGARVAVQAEIAHFTPQGRGDVTSVLDVGWSSPEERTLAERPYLTSGCRADPSASRLMDRASAEKSRWLARRSDLISDRKWYASAFFTEARAPAGIDHLIHSVTPLLPSPNTVSDGELVSGLTLIRARGERDFSQDELELVGLFHGGAFPLWQRHRRRTIEEVLSDFELSRRERQTVLRLLQGQSPTEIADLLSISRNTCRQYVKSIYRKLQVQSRAQLMARFGRR